MALTTDSLSIALIGSGGAGVMTAGSLLLDAAGRAGLYGLMTRSSGPQIRGGEAAALLRISTKPVRSHADQFDILFAIDWRNAERFQDEIPLRPDGLVIGDTEGIEVPSEFNAPTLDQFNLPLSRMVKLIPGGRSNMFAVGILGELVGLPDSSLNTAVTNLLSVKGESAVEAGQQCIEAGRSAAQEIRPSPLLKVDFNPDPARWSITGNEAAGLGALRGGVRFVAAYPITPATDMLEWLATALPRTGGTLVQAEDELASVNQVIGASFGGIPALTATSGPGLSLMSESIGLAVASETPIVVVDVMRGGPSTGIPTKSEQSDLNMAVFGIHGDGPHLVVAPISVTDCLFTTQWAVFLAESLQTACVVLSDQSLGQTRTIVDPPAEVEFLGQRLTADTNGDYQRYRLTESGVSPMSIPGTPGAAYTAEGLSHDSEGHPSSQAEHHKEQLEKRSGKLARFEFGDAWAVVGGEEEADTVVLTWGSSSGPVFEATQQLIERGEPVKVIVLRLLSPAQPERLDQLLSGARRILVVEQSHGRQFYEFLRAKYDIKVPIKLFNVPGPLPIRPGEIAAELQDWTEI